MEPKVEQEKFQLAGLLALILVIFFTVAIVVKGLIALAASPLVPPIEQIAHLPLQPTGRKLPAPPQLENSEARSIYVSLEDDTSWPIMKKNVDIRNSLASLTKLMTALVVLDTQPDWQAVVVITKADQRGGARTPLSPGLEVSVKDLWSLSLLSSDNDATAALVRSTGLSEDNFVELMNAKARQLGLPSTHFVEPTGLSAQNVSSAREVAALARVALTNQAICEVLRSDQTMVTLSGRAYRAFSSDLNLRQSLSKKTTGDFSCGKTGHIEESGYNVVFLQAIEDGRQALIVVLGEVSQTQRIVDSQELVNWAIKTVSK